MNKSMFSLLALLSLAIHSNAQSPVLGFSITAAEAQLSTEKKFDALLNPANVDQFIKDLSAVPHHLGSPGDEANIKYIAGKFKSWGFDTEVETFYVLFPTPVTRVLEVECGVPPTIAARSWTEMGLILLPRPPSP